MRAQICVPNCPRTAAPDQNTLLQCAVGENCWVLWSRRLVRNWIAFHNRNTKAATLGGPVSFFFLLELGITERGFLLRQTTPAAWNSGWFFNSASLWKHCKSPQRCHEGRTEVKKTVDRGRTSHAWHWDGWGGKLHIGHQLYGRWKSQPPTTSYTILRLFKNPKTHFPLNQHPSFPQVKVKSGLLGAQESCKCFTSGRRMETFVGPLCFLPLNPLNLAPFCWFRSQSCQVEEAMMKRKVRDTESNEGDGLFTDWVSIDLPTIIIWTNIWALMASVKGCSLTWQRVHFC